uniref:Lipoprotein n=1 Tax=Streptomyces sp. NBC_01393 TaxID=2903851 RepID=A0AAU3HQB8_9ACTN
MKRAHALIGAALSGTLLVSACSESDGGMARSDARSAPTSREVKAGDHGDDAKDFTHDLPIAKYEYSPDQERLIARAKDALTRGCMQRFDLGYHPTDTDITDTPTPSDRRYGISDPSEAERYGYHLAPSPQTVPVPSTDPSYPVLYGAVSTFDGQEVPKGGCRAEAVRAWEKQRPTTKAADVAREIAVDGFRKSLSDPSVLEVTKQWASCMKAEGFSYSSPLAPPRDFELDTPAVPDNERKVAVADLSCKKQTNLLNVWFNAESRIQRADIQANKGRLAQLSAEHGKVAAFARSTGSAPSKASPSNGG